MPVSISATRTPVPLLVGSPHALVNPESVNPHDGVSARACTSPSASNAVISPWAAASARNRASSAADDASRVSTSERPLRSTTATYWLVLPGAAPDVASAPVAVAPSALTPQIAAGGCVVVVVGGGGGGGGGRHAAATMAITAIG